MANLEICGLNLGHPATGPSFRRGRALPRIIYYLVRGVTGAQHMLYKQWELSSVLLLSTKLLSTLTERM